MTPRQEYLISQIRALVIRERKLTREILEKIAQVDSEKLYAELGYSSLMAWLTEDLKYSKSAAYRRMQAARLILSTPHARNLVEHGEVGVTTLASLQTAIRQEELRTRSPLSNKRKEELVAKIQNKSAEETERIVATEFPELEPRPQESLRVVGDGQNKMTVILNDEQMALLKRAQEVTSHSHFNASWAELIEVIAREFLRHKDPLERKLKSAIKSGSGAEPILSRLTEVKQDKRVTAAARFNPSNQTPLRHSIRVRILKADRATCTYQSPYTGKTCGSRNLVEVDHRIPRAYGGGNEIGNLRCLCRTHNALVARQLLLGK